MEKYFIKEFLKKKVRVDIEEDILIDQTIKVKELLRNQLNTLWMFQKNQ